MADFLKISTPLVDKMPVNPNRPVADPSVPFNLSDITKVIQTNQQSELLSQNNGLIEEGSPNILMNMLKDPSVTVGFLRNIFLLQEMIKLLPVNNNAFTQEIQMLFDRLLVKPEDIVAELMRQENSSTSFKGELFDHLRSLLQQTPKPEMAYGIANLLKAVNGILNKRSILDSLSNSLLFLAESTKTSTNLAQRLTDLSVRFLSKNAPEQFQSLKQEVLAILRDVEGSILFSPKLEKILPLITYNLSRFNDNPDYLQDATANLLTLVDGEEKKQKLTSLLFKFLTGQEQPAQENSRVMDVLAEIISRQTDAGRQMDAMRQAGQQQGAALTPEQLESLTPEQREALVRSGVLTPDGNLREEFKPLEKAQIELSSGKLLSSDDMRMISSEKVDKIVHSLLSSPCNFTPLLHFIVPVQTEQLRSFAELWIDPNDEGDPAGGKSSTQDNVHMLIVFDVEGIGRFETELYVRGKEISLNLLCPPVYTDMFAGVGDNVARAASAIGYRLKDIVIGRLERSRSLMEVFKTLPYRRAGIDVKI